MLGREEEVLFAKPRIVILVLGCPAVGCGVLGEFSLRVAVELEAEAAVTLEVTEVTDWRSTIVPLLATNCDIVCSTGSSRMSYSSQAKHRSPARCHPWYQNPHSAGTACCATA